MMMDGVGNWQMNGIPIEGTFELPRFVPCDHSEASEAFHPSLGRLTIDKQINTPDIYEFAVLNPDVEAFVLSATVAELMGIVFLKVVCNIATAKAVRK